MAEVVGLFTSPAAGEPMVARSAVAVGVEGLAGDRYCSGNGTWQSVDARKGVERQRQVSLIGMIGLQELSRKKRWSAAEDKDLLAQLSRRNIAVDGLSDLSLLLGSRFMIGGVELAGEWPCDPCPRPNTLSGGQLTGFNELESKHGLRASILKPGTIRLGDRFVLL